MPRYMMVEWVDELGGMFIDQQGCRIPIVLDEFDDEQQAIAAASKREEKGLNVELYDIVERRIWCPEGYWTETEPYLVNLVSREEG